jgi:hypothetical protein
LGITITCTSVWAQATAQISGTIKDQSGAVLPGVEVIATQTDTGIVRNTITNETGSYLLPNLATGPYRMEATLPGFRTFVQTGIVLQVNGNPVINPVLEVGQITDQVEVQANLAQVETRTTAVGQVIENERILELPLNGRQVTDLITLSGASVQTGGSGNTNWQGGVQISIAGGLGYGVSYSLDGSMHGNPNDGSQMPLPFPDALEEFRVDASGSPASGGRLKSSGAVNAVTKSGTNEFHGDAFYFVRNYLFNARNAFAPQRDSLKRNQFGGTAGGPMLRNKLFFFGGYQGTLTRSDPGNLTAYVPTAAVLSGDFTAFAAAPCNAGRAVTLRAPFVNNRINPATYSAAALKIVAKLPKPTDECGRTTYGYIEQRDEHQAVGKVDYQWSDKHSVFGRFMTTTYYLPHPYNVSGNVLATTNMSGFDNLATSFTMGSTYLVSPNTVNSFRVAFNRIALHRLGPQDMGLGSKELGLKTYGSVPGLIELRVLGGGSFLMGNGSFSEAKFATTSLGASDEIGLIKGNHQMSFGGNTAAWRHKQRAFSRSVGEYEFNGIATGLGMGDFLTGRLSLIRQGSDALWSTEEWYFGAHAADVWQVGRTVTINYGVRWEPYLPQRPTERRPYIFNYDEWLRGGKSKVYADAPLGVFFAGDAGWEPSGIHWINNSWLSFAPRMGLAWDVRGDGRTSIRTSYGIAYDVAGAASLLGGNTTAAPWGGTTTLESPAGGFEDPWRDFPGGNPFPAISTTSGPPTPFASYQFPSSFDIKMPRVQQWNLSIQRQVAADFLLSASYIGNHMTRLWTTRQLNEPVFISGVGDANRNCFINGKAVPFNVNAGAACSTTGNTNDRRPLMLQNRTQGVYFGSVGAREADGTSNYHGMLLSVQRRATRGVNIGGNYTWSHCISDSVKPSSQTRFGDADLRRPQVFENGNCNSDRRHIFNLTAVADTPQFANPTLHALATGWRLSSIYRRSSGSYLSLTGGTNRSLQGGTQVPNQILPNPYLDKSGVRYLNPAAFEQPAIGTFGNMGPRNILGVGTWAFDLALSRTFNVREGQRLEFRAEAFNITNSFRREFSVVREGNQGTVLNSNIFGQIDAALDPRIMQFALKYVF